jgi:hypothetical protein
MEKIKAGGSVPRTRSSGLFGVCLLDLEQHHRDTVQQRQDLNDVLQRLQVNGGFYQKKILRERGRSSSKNTSPAPKFV